MGNKAVVDKRITAQKTKKKQSRNLSSYDVVIAGGGYVGLSLALALKQACSDLAICLIDARPSDAVDQDERASAIAASAIKMLELLNIWETILPHAQPINDMIVTDSKTNDPVRPVFLTFAGAADDGAPFAHMVPNGIMTGALRERAKALDVEMITPQTVEHFDVHLGGVKIGLGSGAMIEAKLLVAADGARSRLREQAGIRTVGWNYGQAGIVTTVAHERPHHGRAEEHFLPAGPFAILPLINNRSSIVWTEKQTVADRLVNGDDFTFKIELERRFGRHLGEIEVVGPKKAFPLQLKIAHSFVTERLALVGDAAHAIHPISGQGLNLGYRDVAALAETLIEAHRLGLDIGSLAVLERYQRWRRFDTVQMGIVTDLLNRGFSNDNGLIRAARNFGLSCVDRLPFLKRYFINEAAGTAGELPRLLRGEMI